MAWFTYLVPNSQDFFNGFPHEKYVVIALAKVHPVPCVFLVAIFLFLKILISFLLTNTSLTVFVFKCPPLTKTLLAP